MIIQLSNFKHFVKILQYLYRKRTIHSILLDVLQSFFKCKLASKAFEIKQNIFHPSKITASDVEKNISIIHLRFTQTETKKNPLIKSNTKYVISNYEIIDN